MKITIKSIKDLDVKEKWVAFFKKANENLEGDVSFNKYFEKSISSFSKIKTSNPIEQAAYNKVSKMSMEELFAFMQKNTITSTSKDNWDDLYEKDENLAYDELYDLCIKDKELAQEIFENIFDVSNYFLLNGYEEEYDLSILDI